MTVGAPLCSKQLPANKSLVNNKPAPLLVRWERGRGGRRASLSGAKWIGDLAMMERQQIWGHGLEKDNIVTQLVLLPQPG